MQVAPNSDGIQKLLAAEQEAARIIAEARKGGVYDHVSESSPPHTRLGMLTLIGNLHLHGPCLQPRATDCVKQKQRLKRK